MSAQDYDELPMRPGELSCVCGPAGDIEGALDVHDLWRLAAGFGLAVLAQALVLSALPETSSLIAPTPSSLGWPYALLLIGAALASLPAAFLIDAFGRRSAFALGSSLGIAGGLLAAWGASHGNFPALCLGAFWLGLAQGFSLFYRHIAARGSAMATRAGLLVLAGGAAAAGGAPAIIGLGLLLVDGVGSLLIGAALMHVAALWLSSRLPHAVTPLSAERRPGIGLSPRFFVATLAGSIAWFIMAGGMLHGPLTLSLCSASRGFIGAAMAWHLLAMYGPAALAARWPSLLSPLAGIGGGLAVMLIAAMVLHAGASAASVAAALIAIAVGWSLANIGAMKLLHDEGRPPRAALALHDLCLLSAAAAGALAF
jgi:MFS family permease